MEGEEESSIVAWCWVIEALSTSHSHLLDVSHLYELVPQNKVLGEPAREALALRCLESLFASNPNPNPNDSHSFDLPHTSSQDFLLSSLRQISSTCGDVLQSNVQSFINHKKQPSTLHLLKNALVEGKAPLAASLKDISGLALSHHSAPSNSPPNVLQAIDTSGRHVVEAKLPDADSPAHASDDDDHDVDNLEPAGKKIKLDPQQQCGVQTKPLPPVSLDHSNLSNDLVCQENQQVLIATQTQGGNSSEDAAVGSRNQPQVPANRSEHHGEGVAIAKSKCGFSENFITLTESETNLCMKCDKGGQLLACSGTACPLLFHHTCLGCSVSYDDQGNYLCPICAYRRAISEYARAKEKVSSARTQLSLFIGGNTSFHSGVEPNRALGEDINHQKA